MNVFKIGDKVVRKLTIEDCVDRRLSLKDRGEDISEIHMREDRTEYKTASCNYYTGDKFILVEDTLKFAMEYAISKVTFVQESTV